MKLTWRLVWPITALGVVATADLSTPTGRR